MDKYYSMPAVRIEIDGMLIPEVSTVDLARVIVARDNAEAKYRRAISRLVYGDPDPYDGHR